MLLTYQDPYYLDRYMPNFCHLHVLSQYSMRQSLVRLGPLLQRVKDLGQPAVALTDRNGLYGVVPFVQLADEQGIQPVIGCELHVLSGQGEIRPVTLLAENREGYSNLSRLITQAKQADPPAVPRDLLLLHQEGLILLTGGEGAEIPDLVATRKEGEALRLLRRYREVFAGRCYLELMAAHRTPYLYSRLRELSTYLDIPPVVTQDVRYLTPREAPLWLSLQYAHRQGHPANCSRHLAGEEELRRIWYDVPEAIANTWKIAQRCKVDLELGVPHLPEFKLVQGGSASDE